MAKKTWVWIPLGVGGLLLVVTLMWTQEDASTQLLTNPDLTAPIVRDLGPETQLHTVERVFRQYPPGGNEPDMRTTEAFFVFDDTGALESYSAQTVDGAGTVIETEMLDGLDLVTRDGTGEELHRLEGFKNLRVEGLKERFREATLVAANLVGQPSVSTSTLNNASVHVIENRRSFGGSVEPLLPEGVTLPYPQGIEPTEEIRRDYVLADELRSVRSEVLIVDADGTETLVESREWLVFEVTQR